MNQLLLYVFQLLQVDFEFLKSVEKYFQLAYFMWRFVAINVAVAVLKQQPRYEVISIYVLCVFVCTQFFTCDQGNVS